MTGTITSLRPGGFGFIASDAFGRPWALPFRAEAVIGGEFSRLRVGDVVRFDQINQLGNRQRSQAVRVSRLLRSALPRGTRSD
jgi:cold shock CspA family protein